MMKAKPVAETGPCLFIVAENLFVWQIERVPAFETAPGCLEGIGEKENSYDSSCRSNCSISRPSAVMYEFVLNRLPGWRALFHQRRVNSRRAHCMARRMQQRQSWVGEENLACGSTDLAVTSPGNNDNEAMRRQRQGSADQSKGSLAGRLLNAGIEQTTAR